MYKYHRLFLLFIFFFFTQNTFCQTQAIENLKQRLNSAKNDNEKINYLFDLCQKRHSLATDTLYKYASYAKELSNKLQNDHDIILSDYYYTNYLIKKGHIDSAVTICNKYISELKKNSSEKKQYLNFVATKAALLIKQDHYKESFEEYYDLLVESEQAHDTLNYLLGFTGLGWVNMEMNNNRDAVQYFSTALAQPAAQDTSYGEYVSFIYSDIAAAYSSLGIRDSAEYFINKAIPLARKFENLTSLANSLAIQADILSASNRNKEAENALVEVIKIRKQIGDPFFIVSDMSQLAIYYQRNNEPQKGIAISLEGIDIAEKNNLSSKLLLLYDALAKNYNSAGDYNNYAKTLEKIVNLKDSLYKKNSAEALAGIEAKYEMQKKENTILAQHLDLVKKNFLLAGSLLLALLIAISAIIVFRIYRKKQQLKMQFMMEEEKRLATQAVFTAEEKERKRIAADLHDNMGAYATAIIANVDDIVFNQNKTESTYTNLKANATELMNNLRDTIWASNTGKIFLTGISDRFKNYIKKLKPAYPNVTIEIIENIENDISLSSLHALNVFRILQEATTNALKHSGASKIEIYFESNSSIKFTVKDSGIGFNDNLINNGNGIKNMSARAAESGYSVAIEENSPNGTVVSVISEPILHT